MRISDLKKAVFVAGVGIVCAAQAELKTIAWTDETCTVSANKTYGDRGPIRAVDGTGLTGNAHNTEKTSIWQAGSSAISSGNEAWLRIGYDKTYLVGGIKFWNNNYDAPNRGMEQTKVYVSTDGSAPGTMQPQNDSRWTLVKELTLDQASGSADYSGSEIYEFDPTEAQYVLLLFSSAKSSSPGLSEVQCFEEVSSDGVRLDSCAMTGNSGAYVVSGKVLGNPATKTGIRVENSTGVVTNLMTDAAVAVGGTFSQTLEASDLEQGKTYKVSALGVNGSSAVAREVGTIYAGTLTLTKVADAQEMYSVPGTVTVSRASAEAFPLTVNYAFASATATEGIDYVEPTGTIVIPAGAQSVDIVLVPVMNVTKDADETITVSLTAGNYSLPTTGVEMTIVNASLPTDRNLWIAGADSDGLASTAENWTLGMPREEVPASLIITLDGSWSNKELVWDADTKDVAQTVTSWMQLASYTNEVTIRTMFPASVTDANNAFTCFTVTGTMSVEGGSISHPRSLTIVAEPQGGQPAYLMANEKYRLRLDVGSLFVGAKGRIDADNKGLFINTWANMTLPPAHGGRMNASSADCYGEPKLPIHIGTCYKWSGAGSSFRGTGGGAVYITSTGDITVNGSVSASSGVHADGSGSAAAGSVYLLARNILGSGSIRADGESGSTEVYTHGCGGRVAVVARQTIAQDTLTVSAGVTSSRNGCGGAGTVYLKDKDMDKGLIIVSNGEQVLSASRSTAATTDVTVGSDWSADEIRLSNCAYLGIIAGESVRKLGPVSLDDTSTIDLKGARVRMSKLCIAGKKIRSGTYTAESGIAAILDSVGGGELVIGGQGFRLVIR